MSSDTLAHSAKVARNQRGVLGRVAVVLTTSAWIAAPVALLMWLGVPVCGFAAVFHVPCPGCGLTRASLRLLAGDLSGCLSFHPLAPIIVPSMIAFFGINTFVYIRTGRWGWVEQRGGKTLGYSAVALFVVLIGIWIARFFGAFGGPVSV